MQRQKLLAQAVTLSLLLAAHGGAWAATEIDSIPADGVISTDNVLTQDVTDGSRIQVGYGVSLSGKTGDNGELSVSLNCSSLENNYGTMNNFDTLSAYYIDNKGTINNVNVLSSTGQIYNNTSYGINVKEIIVEGRLMNNSGDITAQKIDVTNVIFIQSGEINADYVKAGSLDFYGSYASLTADTVDVEGTILLQGGTSTLTAKTINAESLSLSFTNNPTNNLQVTATDSMTVTDAMAVSNNMTVDVGNTLQAGSLDAQSGSTINAGNLTVDGTLTVDANAKVTVDNLLKAGSLANNGGWTAKSLEVGTLTNNKELNLEGYLKVTDADGLTNYSNITASEITATDIVNYNTMSADTITATSGGLYNCGDADSDTKTSVIADKIILAGTLTNSGADLTVNNTLQANEIYNINGSIHQAEGSTHPLQITVNGVFSNDVASTVTADSVKAGTLNNYGTVTAASNIEAGTLTNEGTVTAAANIKAGTLTNYSTIASTADDSKGSLQIEVQSGFENQGTLRADGVSAGALINLGNTFDVDSLYVKNYIDNIETIRANSVTVDGNITNSGDIDVTGKVTVQGKLNNSDKGSLQAAEVEAGTIELNNGSVSAVTVDAGTITINQGAVTADTIEAETLTLAKTSASDNSLTAKDSLTVTGTMTVGEGAIVEVENTLTVGTLANGGEVMASGNVKATEALTNSSYLEVLGTVTTEGTLTNSGTVDASSVSAGELAAQSGSSLTANNGLTVSGAMTVNEGASVTATSGLVVSGKLTNDGSLTTSAIEAGSFTNNSALNLSGNLKVTGEFVNTADVTAAAVEAGSLTNSAKLNSESVTVTGTLTNSGTVDAAAVAAESITNTGKLTTQAELTLSGALTNEGTLNTNGNDVSASALTNSGTFNAAAIDAGTLTNTGTLIATGDVTFDGELTNSGTLATQGEVTANGTLVNSGTLDSNGNDVQVASLSNSGSADIGTLTFTDNDATLKVNGGSLKAKAINGQDVTITVTGANAEQLSADTFSGANLTINANGNEREVVIEKLTIDNLTLNVNSLTSDQVVINTMTITDEGSVTVKGDSSITDRFGNDMTSIQAGMQELADTLNIKSGEQEKNLSAEIIAEDGKVLGEITGTLDSDGSLTVNAEALNIYNQGVSEMASIALMTWRQENNDMNKRMGELRDSVGEHGVWARMTRGESKYGAQNIKNQYNSYQLGYDEKLSVDKHWTVGAALTYTDGESSFANGRGENKHKGLAIYGSRLNDDGSFIDLIAKYSRLEHEFEVRGGAGKGDYETNGYSVSAEYGKRFTGASGLWIEPQVELTYGKVGSVNYVTDNGVSVRQDGMDSLVGRLGFALGKNLAQNRGNVYLRASYMYDFEGETDVRFTSGVQQRGFEQDLGGGWWEVGVGANVNLSEATHLYFDVEKTYGGDVATPWQWNAGVRWSF